MKKDLGIKTYIYPLPVLIISTYNEDDTPNAMNAAWGTICDMNKVALFLSADHKTTKNILKRKAFSISIATSDYVADADFVGIVSGNDLKDKLTKTRFTTTKSKFVDAPIINELPLTLECKFESFAEDSECLIGEIINVCADEKILDSNNKIIVSKLNPISYDPANHDYIVLGKKVGKAFKDGLKLK